jgi:DNA ligase-1
MSAATTAKAFSREPKKPRFVSVKELLRRRDEGAPFAELFGSIGATRLGDAFVEEALGLPLHLRFAIESKIDAGEEVGGDALASIPFYSLCKGLFLPLSMLHPERVAAYFGIEAPLPPDAAAREALLATFLQKDVGLSLTQKLACVLGDAFRGRKSTFKRDSMMALLLSTSLQKKRTLLDRLTVVGDVAVLFAEARPEGPQDPPLTAAEVLEALRFLPDAPRQKKFSILRSLLQRMGKLEAYFLAKLLLRKAGFGFDYQGPLLSRALADAASKPRKDPRTGNEVTVAVSADEVGHAVALTDYFKVAQILETEGAAGLKKIHLQPLVPIRPALASGSVDEIEKYPVWVERKLDGIRLMVHKSTDPTGATLVGAYTRTRGDWLDQIAGLEQTARMLPCRDVIIDGELHGSYFADDGWVPATVYDIHGSLTGMPTKNIQLRYSAFDILYLNGQDLTSLPQRARRQHLQAFLAPLLGLKLPMPVSVVDGQYANTRDDVSRLFHYFRNQGDEGIIGKDPNGPYRIATRDPSWVKRKPLITLDLVLLGGVLAVTTKERTGMFGSYVIGARRDDGSFEDVGDVAGVDVERDRVLQSEIVREGLITGRRIERPSASGVRPGLELRPHIVVTVKFEGITKDNVTKRLSLRDPKIAQLRTDKGAFEADTTKMIEELSVRERFG